MTQKTRKINVSRLYADDAGESHFSDEEMDVFEGDFAPPAPPMYVSKPMEAKQAMFLLLPVGYYGDLHPAPRRQVMTLLSGALEVAVSDGETRAFKPGESVLVEDTSGKGHATKCVDGQAVLVVVQL